ncbi:MAG TPA: glycoside hydrolase family 140 protein [Gemmatimonadaceae bacterium]|nr:glycoside hydrolase family 140 protein [Gemmatimonadaceae bacterium]
MFARSLFACSIAVLLTSAPVSLGAQTPSARGAAPSVDLRHGALRVSRDGRHLVHADGTPFFWLGDTAWELFHRLTREEADLYLDDRQRKGFTVIQAVVLAEFDGLTVPNAYGDRPLVNDDPTALVEGYFRHVDYVVDAAERRGMFVGMLPTWGDKFNKKWGAGPEIFTPENARAYGELLGRRYKNKPIVWILGGDRSPESPLHLAIVRAMAEGLRAGDGGAHLMTYHPTGAQSSSRYFHADDWLAFDMFQSGHNARNIANDRYVENDRSRTPVKPVVDGESRYEDHPIDWKPANGWFDDFDVRQGMYWSVLAGAAGHTYGDHDIWQFWQPGRTPISAARTNWREALHHPGSAQVGYARRLFMSHPFLELVPDQAMLAAGADSGAAHQRAARARDGSYAMIYTPFGRSIAVRMDALRGPSVAAAWFDPRTGVTSAIGSFRASGARTFDPPGDAGRGNDWVLVLDGER